MHTGTILPLLIIHTVAIVGTASSQDTLPIRPGMSWVYYYHSMSQPELTGDSLVTGIYIDSLDQRGDSTVIYTTETFRGKYDECNLWGANSTLCSSIDTMWHSTYLLTDELICLDTSRPSTSNNISPEMLTSAYQPNFLDRYSASFIYCLNDTRYYFNRQGSTSTTCISSSIGLVTSSSGTYGSANGYDSGTDLVLFCDSLIDANDLIRQFYENGPCDITTIRNHVKKYFHTKNKGRKTFDFLGRKVPLSLPLHSIPVSSISIEGEQPVKQRLNFIK